jgi:chaperonin cofactor prefoldin
VKEQTNQVVEAFDAKIDALDKKVDALDRGMYALKHSIDEKMDQIISMLNTNTARKPAKLSTAR